jgi:hypothetical protein
MLLDMIPHISFKGVRYAVLGIVSLALTAIGIQVLMSRSTAIQNLLHTSMSKGAVYADNGSACIIKKDLKDEVFFVSCGGFF